MSALQEICDAIWVSAVTRELLDPGSAFGVPTNGLEAICKAIWEYETRTLTSTPLTITTEGSYEVTLPVSNGASVATMAADGGTLPYSWEIVSQVEV